MDYTLAIVFSLLQVLSMCTAAPLPLEVAKMKSNVKLKAEQLIIKLDTDFKPHAGQTLSPPADYLDGISSVVMILEGYNNLIPENFYGVEQIKTEISSLAGFLDQWRQGHCNETRPKPSLPEPLQKLQSQKTEFAHTVSMEALMRVKEFLNLLLKKLNQLETC